MSVQTSYSRKISVSLLALGLASSPAAAQQTGASSAPPAGPQIGEMAPDFALAGATRYGLLEEPVRLSELRGNTVVLAFFFRARTKG